MNRFRRALAAAGSIRPDLFERPGAFDGLIGDISGDEQLLGPARDTST